MQPGAWRFGGALPGGRRRRRREAVGLDAWLDPCFLFIHPPPHDVGVHVRLHRSPLGGKTVYRRLYASSERHCVQPGKDVLLEGELLGPMPHSAG